MKKLIASLITGAFILSPFAASAKDVVQVGKVTTTRNICVGIRLDDVTTFHKFLKEYALDLKAAEAILKDPDYTPETNAERLAQAKWEKYKIASSRVKDGQTALCGKVSDNWHD